MGSKNDESMRRAAISANITADAERWGRMSKVKFK
jgi:hypothetical protein